MPKKPDPADDASLKRLGGGRWQTRDERFTIEPQSGTWVIVDAEQTDDLGMPLVRGPFPSLTAAKGAIADARTNAPAASPLAGRLAGKPARAGDAEKRLVADGDGPAEAEGYPRSTRATEKPAGTSTAAGQRPQPEAPAEPSWIADLPAADRGRARRLIATLTEAGIADAEGIVRRDLVGGVPSIAAVAVARRIEALGDDADPAAVAAALADGRDEALGVRWRLVDDEGRPILVEPPARRAKR